VNCHLSRTVHPSLAGGAWGEGGARGEARRAPGPEAGQPRRGEAGWARRGAACRVRLDQSVAPPGGAAGGHGVSVIAPAEA
jgi:hypothetical protein